MREDKVLVSLLIAIESGHFYSAMLPSYFTIKTFAKGDEEKIRALRSGYFPSVGLSLLTGALAAQLLDSALPLIATVVVTAMMIGAYEWAIRGGQA